MGFLDCVTWCLLCCSLSLPVFGQEEPFRLANVYSDGMVLQGTKNVHIWGFGEPGSTIEMDYALGEGSTTTLDDGTWHMTFSPPAPTSSEYNLNFKHSSLSGEVKNLVLKNVLFGDVWVCSGQSNMGMKMHSIFNSSEEIAIAATYTNIRVLQITRVTSDLELDELSVNGTTMSWGPIDIETIGDFSAACLLYGERMSDKFNKLRPIGLIDASWHGTRIEPWVSTRVTTYCNTPPSSETELLSKNNDNGLWNAMIHPLTKITVRGAIWYQGENNAAYNSEYYSCHIQRLVADWRATFAEGDQPVANENGLAFPFGIFQLGASIGGSSARWSLLRWHQTVDIGVLPNIFLPETFMAASYDLLDRWSPSGPIHPRDKQTVATRLANSARALLYGDDFHLYGPVAESVNNVSPGVVKLTYDMDITVQATNGFYYEMLDGSWESGNITGVSGREVTVEFDPDATHLAYGWALAVCEYKECAIYSADQEVLPANVWLWELKKTLD